jgi:hypothetical protein
MICKVWQPRNPPKMLNSIVPTKTDVTWNPSPWNYMNAPSKPSDNYIILPYTNIQTNNVFNLQYRHVRCGRWNTVNNLTYNLQGPDLCISQTSYGLRPHITKSLSKINASVNDENHNKNNENLKILITIIIIIIMHYITSKRYVFLVFKKLIKLIHNFLYY